MPEPKKEKKEKLAKDEKKEVLNNKEEKKDLTSVYKNYEIIIKPEELNGEFDNTLKKYRGEIKLSGFRKGKVPVEVIKAKFGESIREEVIEKLIEKKTLEKIKKDNLHVASNPIVEKLDKNEGKDIKAMVKVEIFPVIKLPELETIEIKIPKETEEEKFDEKAQTDAILEANKKKVKVDNREIRKGDQIEVTIQSQFLDTKRMTPKRDLIFNVEEGAGFEIPDFFKEVLGKKENANFDISRNYPKDFSKKSWAGKKIKHFIKIKRVFEFIKPKLDEEFLKKSGFKDEKEFKSELKKRFEEHLKHHKEEKIFNEIKSQISEKIRFDVPESLVINEVNRTAGQYGQLIMSLPEEKRKEYLDSLKDSAEKSLKFSLILDEIVKKYKIDVDSKEFEDEIKSISESNNIDIKEVRKYYSLPENKESLKNNILSRKSVDFLKEKVKLKEV